MQHKKLWQTTKTSLHPLVEAFTVGDDYLVDQQLLPYDIEASLAHAEMLSSIWVLSPEELQNAQKWLNEILSEWHDGIFKIQPSQEDGHTAIEQYLTEKYWPVWQKIHTWRSRNDQSLVMIRLFMKDKLFEIEKSTEIVIKSFQRQSNNYASVPMPGYTHMQKAMPTTVGLWLDSFSATLWDFSLNLQTMSNVIDQNPLGSSAGFGIVNFAVDREFTTQKLHFAKTQMNPLYCGFSRGYFENMVLQTLSQSMIIAGKFACDMLLFTTQEFDFFSLPDAFTTGSSIMPQKRNYDIFEVMRANSKIFLAYQQEIQNIVSSIGSGYQRDLQLTKKPFVEWINLCFLTMQLLIVIVDSLVVHYDKLENAMTKDLYATNEAYELVKKGMSFREAYKQVKGGA